MESEDDDPRCGPVQLAMWGFYLEPFEEMKSDVEAAREDESMSVLPERRRGQLLQALLNWDPVKHPRDPGTGKFVERPYDVPDDVADMETADIVSDLAERDSNFAAKIDGLDIGLSDETREQALSESSALDTDLTQKSTGELEDLRDFFMKKQSEAREAQDPAAGAQGKTDTQLDKLMKSTLEKTREIDSILRSRGAA